jgi:hypothetical protein
MLPDTGIDDVKKQRNAEYAKHINNPVLSSLKMEGIRLIFFNITQLKKCFFTTHQYTSTPQHICIPRSFLAINVRNQEKTLCSPCILAIFNHFASETRTAMTSRVIAPSKDQ